MSNAKTEWLPTIEDREYVRSLMHPVTEPGKIANWIAPPAAGIKGKPFEFEYVRLEALGAGFSNPTGLMDALFWDRRRPRLLLDI